jgi:N-acetylmuramoyl-L-alanine amidase
MNIVDKLLTINEYSRSGKKRLPLQAVVIHWTANPKSTAEQDRNYFEARKDGKNGYGSAHYCIQDSLIIRCIPEDEVAYHCGTSQVDPVSKKFYTDYARKKFGKYAADTVHFSPNLVTIGLELHPIDAAGNFSSATLATAIELTADILKRNKLTAEDITTHNLIVGWKNCPKLFTDKPEKFVEFKKAVAAKLV